MTLPVLVVLVPEHLVHHGEPVVVQLAHHRHDLVLAHVEVRGVPLVPLDCVHARHGGELGRVGLVAKRGAVVHHFLGLLD